MIEQYELVRIKQSWVPEWLWQGLCVGNADNPIDMGFRKLLYPIFWILSEPAAPKPQEGESDAD